MIATPGPKIGYPGSFQTFTQSLYQNLIVQRSKPALSYTRCHRVPFDTVHIDPFVRPIDIIMPTMLDQMIAARKAQMTPAELEAHEAFCLLSWDEKMAVMQANQRATPPNPEQE